MMKSIFTTAIFAAATISTGAHATVSSNISGIAMEVSSVGSGDVAVDCATGTPNSGFVTRLALSGVGIGLGEINFVGQVCLSVVVFGSPVDVALDFNLRGQAVMGGTQFNLGNVDTYVDVGSGWIYYNTVDASLLPLDCVVSGTTAGVQWTTVNMLPGFVPNAAACEHLLFGGIPSWLYLTGTNSN